MQTQKWHAPKMLSSFVISTLLLSSCGSGSGDQNSDSDMPEVGQANEEQTQIVVTATPTAPDVLEPISVATIAPELQTLPPASQAPQVVFEADTQIETQAGTNTVPDSESTDINVANIAPEIAPGIEPTIAPEIEPTIAPEIEPTIAPEIEPTIAPEIEPTIAPEIEPTIAPELEPPDAGTEETSAPLVNVACTAIQADIQTSTLQLINEARASQRMCGGVLFEATAPLTWNTKLQDAALVHSLDMTQNDFFGHDGSDGSTAAQRATAQQFDWSSIGENIAAGQQTTELVVQAWLDSPGHCANIMNPKFKETAVVCVEDLNAQYRQYWTNVLGTSF